MAPTCECHAFQEPLEVNLDAELDSPGGALEFGIALKKEDKKWTGWLVNGEERIEVPSVTINDKTRTLTIDIDHYDSKLEFKYGKIKTNLSGTWKKRRGLEKWVEMKVVASAASNTLSAAAKSKPEDAAKFLGRWEVDFKKSDDAAVAIFEKAKDSDEVRGTFLTTTGDYRFLSGKVVDGELTLSCFDGAHAFLFRANMKGEGEERTLDGQFWSSMNWKEAWSAKLNADAKLPDAFEQTKTTEAAKRLGELSFPDLEGNQTRLDDPKFAGKARIVYVFGSWCPNCHDAAKYFSELEKKYGDKGLSIVGLAFELTGDFERDADQVRKYLKRHGSNYPVLIAGVNNKADATKRLTILDKVRSYPTTIFLDANGMVNAVHTGFTGPATGQAYDELRSKFEQLIEEQLRK